MSRARSRSEADWVADAVADLLMRVPVWVGPTVAAVVYLAFRFVVPPLVGLVGKPFGPELAGLSRTLSPLVGVIALGLWVYAEIKRRGRRWILDSRSDIASLRDLTWQEFEQLVGEAYRRRGYVVTETGGGGADGGVDLVLRMAGETTLVQCKHWKTWTVGVRVVRELYGVMAAEKAARGIVVTCGYFTQEAQAFAAGKPLELVDGPALWELVKTVKTPGTPGLVPSGQSAQAGVVRPPSPAKVAPAIAPPHLPEVQFGDGVADRW